MPLGAYVYTAFATDRGGYSGEMSRPFDVFVVVPGASTGNAADMAAGSAAGNAIDGKNGNDTLFGQDGNDTLKGGDGMDTLSGGDGADRLFGDASGDWIMVGGDKAADTVFGTVAHLSGDAIQGFVTGKSGDVVAITGLAAKSARLLDSIAITDGVLSLSKVGGGSITFEDMAGIHYTDTMQGSDGSILVYVM